jgi:hypothetical protein
VRLVEPTQLWVVICQAAKVLCLGPETPQRTFEELIDVERLRLRHRQILSDECSTYSIIVFHLIVSMAPVKQCGGYAPR